MNIFNSVDWYVDGSVGAKVDRGNNGGVDIAVDDEVGSGDGEGVVL